MQLFRLVFGVPEVGVDQLVGRLTNSDVQGLERGTCRTW